MEKKSRGIEAQQLEMFGDIGMAKSTAKRDPVSGNEIPKASTAEEVRDDIPAQLSEGEFVLPADVVRYHGLEKLMNLRQEAKQGINTMDKMGQLGNADEATIPDDLPFDINDIEMSEGGFVNVAGQPMKLPMIAGRQMQTGGVVTPTATGTFQIPTQLSSTPSYFQNYAQTTAPFSPFAPKQQTPVPPTSTPVPNQNIPTFQDLIPSQGQRPVTVEYRNAAGQRLFIPFINGRPIYPIPEGYTRYVEETTPIAEDKPVVTTPTTTVSAGEGGESSDSVRVGTSIDKKGKGVTDKSLTENQKTGMVMDALDKAKGADKLGRAIQTLGLSVMPFGLSQLSGDIGKPDPTALNDMISQQQTAMGTYSGMTPEEIDQNPMGNLDAMSMAAYGMSLSDKANQLGMSTMAYAEVAFTKGYKPGQVDPTTNATYSINGQATDDKGNVSYSSFSAFSNAMAASGKSGYFGGEKQAKEDAKKGNKKAQNFLNNLEIETLKDRESFTGSKDDTFGYDESQGTDPGDKPGDTSISDVGSEEDPDDPTDTEGGVGQGISDISDSDLGNGSDNGNGDGNGDGENDGEESGANKGMLVTRKKKPKPKKMKRGGLASR